MENLQRQNLAILLTAVLVACRVGTSSAHRWRYPYPYLNSYYNSGSSIPSTYCVNGQCYHLPSVPSTAHYKIYNSPYYSSYNSGFFPYPGVTLNTVGSTSTTTNSGLNGCIANGIICFNSGKK
ncbi:hypothetical protein RvY_08545 [Ramazzottius varieornatus]|uniref:Secreted protein n=1 Tax=Ramazzottius varieornatus TaxID=947166 RepID=A0A1D1V671_RAMVA|nr:hypothetical protein RvY_08545 [Ramazzottius varieornatus]